MTTTNPYTTKTGYTTTGATTTAVPTTTYNPHQEKAHLTPISPVVTPHQEPHRVREAQDLLHRLQTLLMEGDAPGVDILSDALVKAEEMLYSTARHPDMDPETRKALEDITALLLAARQLGRNKGIADRLQKISIETQEALKASQLPNATQATKDATLHMQEYINNWRPLFYLIMSSKDFRQLILDSIKIAKNMLNRYEGGDFKYHTQQKFVEGAPAKEIAHTAKLIYQQKEGPDMTDEESIVLQDDIQRVLAILAREPTFRDGIERLFFLLDQFQASVVQTPLTSTANVLPDDIHLRRVVNETEDLVASFSGRESLERFKYHLRNLIAQIQRNPNLHIYLNDLKVFILKAKSEEYIRTEEFTYQSRNLAYRGRDFMNEIRQQPDLDLFLDTARDMLDNVKNDEFVQLLRHHAGVVQADFSYTDTQGNVKVDTDMLSKLQTALLPALADALKYIPVPKIHSEDRNQEFWLDNIVLCSYDIVPENIHFHLESDSDLSLRDIEVKHTRTNLVISATRLRTELKDIEFYIKKKTFPTFEDSGRATFRIKGEGSKLTFTFNLVQEAGDATPRIRKGYADFDITDMAIEFDKKSLDHPHLVPMLTNLFKNQIRRQIEKKVEANLDSFMERLGEMMTKSLSDINRPFMSGIERARSAVKSTQLSQVYEKRREIME
jgi:hypothetical protein